MSLKRHHHSRITLNQESTMFNLWLKDGNTLKYYADKYGTSIQTVKRVIEEGLIKMKK